MENVNSQINKSHIGIAFLIGLGIGVAVISFLVFNVSHPKAEWGEYWRVRPLILTPIVVGVGSVIGYVSSRVAMFYGLNKWFGFAMAFLSLLISLWMGIVIGCNGTLWN